MRSKKIKGLALSLLCVEILLHSGCGVLGEKEPLSDLMNYSPESVGCLNEVGNRFEKFGVGEIEPAVWEKTWDCAINSLNLFKKFVKSESPEGYTQADIQALVSRFMLTNKTITPELISALFEFKASVFGGNKVVLSFSEIDRINQFLSVAKIETSRLIPFLKARKETPNPDHLLELTDALLVLGDRLALALNTKGNIMFSWESGQVLVDELEKILNFDLPLDAVAWLGAIKVLVTSGSLKGVEAENWPAVLKAAVAYGGPAIAAFSIEEKYLVGPNAAGQFGMRLAWKIRSSLEQTLDLYRGALPLSALDQLIDTLPDKLFPVDKGILKRALRPIVQKVLNSKTPEAIDRGAIDLIFSRLDTWSRGQTHLELIWQRIAEKDSIVSPEEYVRYARAYADELPPAQRRDVFRLILLSKQMRPLFANGENQITFAPSTGHSLDNLSRFHWIRLVAEHFLSVYSSTPDGMRGTVEDLKKLVDDFQELGFGFGVIDPSVPDLHIKRFREADLFTFASNGDKYMDADEATYYIASLYSAAFLSMKIRTGSDLVCPSLGLDPLGNHWKDAECFRREFFGNFREYWAHLPMLIRFYESLNPRDQRTLQTAIEKAARRYGVTDLPVGTVDIDGFSGILQYIETIFARYDEDQSQKLSLNESMQAFSMFKGSLAELGKLNPKDTFLLKAVFTYMLRYGTAPKQNVGGILKLGWWIVRKPFWNSLISVHRLKLYQVISAISVPEPLPGTPPAPPKEGMNEKEFSKQLGWVISGKLDRVVPPIFNLGPQN